ncbi:MAG: DUF4331 domain-containing protein [Planctomycetes bacterium]|nr:DUF4331 domain-containing protein [Planctomycetota bacterium]
MQIQRFARGRFALAALVGVGVLAGSIELVHASSHREAPFVTEHPKVDATDFYMFTSYEAGREGYVTFIANYLPLQDPYGGPNYFTLDPEARYEIRVDNDADAKADVTFRFQFDNVLRDIALKIGNPGQEKTVSVPLKNVGPIFAGDESALNELERYKLDVVLGNGSGSQTVAVRNAANGEKTFSKPVDYIGTKSLPDYETYANSKIYDIELPDGSVGRMFVGQRDDPFVVNLGEAFDLINLNPLGDPKGETDTIADANVTSFVLEIPKSFLVKAGQPTIGAWTAALLPQKRTLLKQPTFDQPALETGTYVQVSRLSMPLVNELVIGLKDKDRFNASQPHDDAQFADYITHPTLPALIEALFAAPAPTVYPRTDLVAVFATGVDGLNKNGSFGEMLRLNTAIPPTPKGKQSNLGVLGGDLAGYPNGRRLGDDVVDMSLRVVMGVLLDPSVAPAGQLPLTDGAYTDDQAFYDHFPYVTTPFPGSPAN